MPANPMMSKLDIEERVLELCVKKSTKNRITLHRKLNETDRIGAFFTKNILRINQGNCIAEAIRLRVSNV